MNRIQLEHIIRAASQISGDSEIIVIGSQAIHAQAKKLPPIAFRSSEADVYPRNYPERADQIDAAIGELSQFHKTQTYYAHGVGRETAILPAGWEQRLISISNANTGGATGLCIDAHDLVLSKYAAGRPGDIEFNREIVRHGIVSKRMLVRLVPSMPIDDEQKRLILDRIKQDFAAANPRKRSPTTTRSYIKAFVPKVMALIDWAFLVRKSGAESGHEIRLRAGVDGRTEPGGAGPATGEGRVPEGVPRGGVRAKTDRARLRRAIAALEPGDVLMVTRLDRLARSTHDLLNTLAAITERKAGFRSLANAWADTTTAHRRLMLIVLGGLAEFERESIRARTAEGRERAKARGQHMGRPAKLTQYQQREAIRRRDSGETIRDIARTYNVSHSTISRLAA